jgi:signal transduction histidine kinase
LSAKLLSLGNRARAIEEKVEQRTKELKIANEQLEKNIQIQARLEEEKNEITANEQRRIGRDLHDSLGQKLTGAVFLSRSLLNWFEKHGAWGMGHGENNSDANTLKSSAPSSQLPAFGPQADHAQTLNETLKSTVTEVRNMARGLASVTLNNDSLDESLEQLADEMSSLYNIDCSFSKNGCLGALERETKEQLYFIAREAVNNAARHAQAERITLRLTGNESGWTLLIEDNGKGLPDVKPAEEGTCPANGGMGLRIMRHRAERIGAEFSIHSEPGAGTCIIVKSV